MKYFKDDTSQVWAFADDGSQDAFIPADLTPITEAEADAIRYPAPTLTQIAAAKLVMVDSYMNAQAKALGYDDIKTACTYADEPAVPKFQQEGQAFREWRSLVYAACYQIMDEVTGGTRPVPTDDELIELLPALELPT